MLRTRIWVGALMAGVTVGILFFDVNFAPVYPILLFSVVALGWYGTSEIWRMLPAIDRPSPVVVVLGVWLVLAANWYNQLLDSESERSSLLFPFAAFIGSFLVTFLLEILFYPGDGHSTRRVAVAVLIIVYLGLLPSFLVQLRWQRIELSTYALAVAIFVPKVCDIFALFTGMAIGRHRFTPTLSPKKTWEGVFGGLAAAVVTAVIFHNRVPRLFHHGLNHSIAFGTAVGLAGVVGDLAESMLKRDCQIKDASKSIPGFGGVLDVVDSVIFAAPLAYLLLTI